MATLPIECCIAAGGVSRVGGRGGHDHSVDSEVTTVNEMTASRVLAGPGVGISCLFCVHPLMLANIQFSRALGGKEISRKYEFIAPGDE